MGPIRALSARPPLGIRGLSAPPPLGIRALSARPPLGIRGLSARPPLGSGRRLGARRWATLLGVGLLAAACASGWPGRATAQTAPGALADLRDATGRLVATAAFSETPEQVLISLTFPDRSALVGTHAIQIHDVGRCDPPDFASAGRIFNPFGKQHGLRNPAGPMAGDVASLVIGPNGVAAYNTAAPLARLGPGPASLLRAGGTSLVIFAQPDDDQSQPEGNPGARIACGVIELPSLRQSRPLNPGSPDLTTAVLIALLGALMIAAGLALRRTPTPR